MSLKLEDLEVYQLAMEIADEVYELVDCWDSFPKKTDFRRKIQLLY